MAQGGIHPRFIGHYLVTEQIGSGSFAVVWRGRHKIDGHEVAIKEIATEKLNRKLQESLLSEIVILKKVHHPNIIRLHEIFEMPGRIYLVLEYCTGGDLSQYIQRHGRVSESLARHLMRQLAAGLQVLRENDLIHRDLKPQNLLLSTDDSDAVLKIADFGFARSLQPQGLAETLCGSPLYMAPEIMQFQKYDAKADLWSVGAILFQLVTGQTPFSGNNQIQLLHNIVKSNELQFPPEVGDLNPNCMDLCRKLLHQNPVERLSFEEFFNHKFLVNSKLDSSPKSIRSMARLSNDSPVAGSNPLSDTEESSQEDCLPFLFDDDSHGHVGRSPFSSKKLPFTDSHLCGIPDNSAMAGRIPSSTNLPSGKELGSGNTEVDSKEQCTGPSHQIQKPSNIGVFRAPVADAEQGLLSNPSSKVVDPFDSIEQEYVFVPISSSELSSSSLSASGLGQSAAKVVGSPIKKLQKSPTVSAPMPIVGAAVGSVGGVGNLGSLGSRPSGTSQGSIDLGDVVDQPSVHPPTRLQSLVQCAHAITELVNDKLDTGKQVEAFLIQLVCLAIWSEALRVCHTWAAFATEGSPSQDVIGSNNLLSKKGSVSVAEMSEDLDLKRAAAACSRVEREFLFAVEHAEELAKYLVPLEGSAEMPDAMEIIFQAALASGRSGAVDELMGNMKKAVNSYTKAATLLYFLLVEATSLILSPPFSLRSSDRHRLRHYIDILTTRQSQSTAHRMAFLQPEGQQSV